MDDIVNSVPSWMFTAIIAVCILFIIGIIFARLYRRASAEQAFVRTGLGGQKVVMSGGAIVMPIFHEIIPINMNTLKLEVSRSTIDSLITKDRMRVDVVVAFFVRVKPSVEGIATAAQTLGQRTLSPEDLRMLVEDKFVDALRADVIRTRNAAVVHVGRPQRRGVEMVQAVAHIHAVLQYIICGGVTPGALPVEALLADVQAGQGDEIEILRHGRLVSRGGEERRFNVGRDAVRQLSCPRDQLAYAPHAPEGGNVGGAQSFNAHHGDLALVEHTAEGDVGRDDELAADVAAV